MLLTFPINLFTVSLILSSALSLFRFCFLFSPSPSFLVYLLFRDTAKVSSRSNPRFRLPLFLRRYPPFLPPALLSPLFRDPLFLDHLFPPPLPSWLISLLTFFRFRSLAFSFSLSLSLIEYMASARNRAPAVVS